VFTHLAASDEPEQDPFTLSQSKIFTEACTSLEKKLGYDFVRHISNTAAVTRHPDLQMDMVRLGIGLYGIDNSDSGKVDLQPVATLKATISQIKKIKAGDSVSYGRKSISSQDAIIATVRIGYADGFPRRLGHGKGSMWIHGKLAPVIGTVCMDMTIIDVTNIPGVKEGDEVIVFGKELPVQKLAEWAETIPYEIMTGISQRVNRVYYEE
jgi:alanine racemase